MIRADCQEEWEYSGAESKARAVKDLSQRKKNAEKAAAPAGMKADAYAMGGRRMRYSETAATESFSAF